MSTLNDELQKIRHMLAETELSYAEIAKQAGIHWKTVSRISAGLEENPRIKTLSAISNAMEGSECEHDR